MAGNLAISLDATPETAPELPTCRARWSAWAFYAVLATGLVTLLLLFEQSHEQSTELIGQVGLDSFQWTRPLAEAFFGWIAGAVGVGLLARGALSGTTLVTMPAYRKLERGVLVLLLLLSATNWLYGAGGVARQDYFKVYDVYHYLLGPKYYGELGYFELYECTVLADAESLHLLGHNKIRDLARYRFKPVDVVLASSRCKASFTPERWREFVHDYEVIGRSAGRDLMARMVRDYGYNGTPFHALISGAIAHAFTIDYRALVAATLIDTLALCALMAGVTSAFGWNLGSLFAITFFTAFSDRFFYIGGSFVRYHWMFLTGFGLLALAYRRYVLAGVLVALAAMLNVFPVLFVLGIGAKMAVQFVRARKISLFHLRFALASAVTAALAFFATLFHARGLEDWRSFLTDMGEHSQLLTVSRIGFRYLFLFRGETQESFSNAARTVELSAIAPAVLPMIAVGLALLVCLAPRLSDLEATILAGFGAFFFLFTTVEYYYGIYAFWTLLFARYQRERATAWILGASFLYTAAIYLVWQRTGFLALCNNTLMSAAIFATLTATMVFLSRRTGSHASPDDERPGRTPVRRLLQRVTGNPIEFGLALIWSVAGGVTIARWPW